MQFLIADTFTDSLTRLTAEEQKAVKTTAFDLQTNPAHPSLKFHRLDRARDKDFWSVRAGSDIRLIVHKSESSLVLCYADHHDKAYAWAERRRMTTHPTTGAAQLVEIRETVQEVVVPVYVQAEAPAPVQPALFADLSDDDLLQYGVPAEWIDDVRQANEDQLLLLTDHLPGEAAEALLELATGGTPQVAVAADADPFEHPDAQRRFRVVEDVEELERALEFPWERWMVFLHPAQREIVERDYGGPARVSGSAGTGKTIVALHRAVFLARSNLDARVLLTTYSETLAASLRARLHVLIGNEPRVAERIEVHAIDALGRRLYRAHAGGDPQVASRDVIERYLTRGFGGRRATSVQPQLHPHGVGAGRRCVAARHLGRLSRRTTARPQDWASGGAASDLVVDLRDGQRAAWRGGAPHRERVVHTTVRAHPRETWPALRLRRGRRGTGHGRGSSPLLRHAGRGSPNALFFAGDLGQRIFQQPFSWRALGVDIRGRSRTLRVNYRTSHQIRQSADRLLDPEQTDADGIVESRAGTISVFNGAPPTIRVLDDESAEIEAVAAWIKGVVGGGLVPGELGVFVRSDAEIDRASRAVEAAGIPCAVLDENVRPAQDAASVGTMHLAKGLEFRAVAVMACDDEVIPSQERIDTVADPADLEEVYRTERHLLYVACTRARDNLLVTGVAPASEFLEDLG